jgi:hypothetical protein
MRRFIADPVTMACRIDREQDRPIVRDCFRARQAQARSQLGGGSSKVETAAPRRLVADDQNQREAHDRHDHD